MGAAQSDIAILGGGLAGGLAALALARFRPDLSVVLIERDAALGGNHVWSFFATDLPAGGGELIEPLIEARWHGYDVRFPGFSRTLTTPYCATTSARLDAAVRAALPADAILTGVSVTGCTAIGVTLSDGRDITAKAIIDARGETDFSHMTGGWQKFFGQHLKLAQPHGLSRPIVMDADVPQDDGYRFVYALPFAPDEVFVEDTYYTDDPTLDRDRLTHNIAAYANARGWQVLGVLAEEHGVLPVVSGGRIEDLLARPGHHGALAGTRAGLFHPMTSYSLPDALRFALALARQPDLRPFEFPAFAARHARNHWKNSWYYRVMTALLFDAARPDRRYRVLRRFYGLNQRLIERFYAGKSTWKDRARILAGRPPLPISSALRVLTGLGARPRPLVSDRQPQG